MIMMNFSKRLNKEPIVRVYLKNKLIDFNKIPEIYVNEFTAGIVKQILFD